MAATAPIVEALVELLRREQRLVLAVSGGVDSMVLLDAAVRARDSRPDLAAAGLVVASFDHGTGAYASEALARVVREATRHALRIETARASGDRAGVRAGSEASWRAARWEFLRDAAQRHDAVVATAHTRDDQVETVVMRELRGAGARGLAGLYAPSAVARPLLAFSRREILDYAARHSVSWIDDPSNVQRRHLRNRVRLDLLPALERVRPSLPKELLALAAEAAELRRRADAVAHALSRETRTGRRRVDREVLRALPPEGRPLFWQSVASLAGVTLDWRGTRRLARTAAALPPGKRIPLSGGFELLARRDFLELRPTPATAPAATTLDLFGETLFGEWRFSRVTEATINEREVVIGGGDPWIAWFAPDASLAVRAWQGGDRVGTDEEGRRRVKRYFSDRRVEAPDREGWPVVLAGDEIIWVPGIRRTRAATARSGRPGVCILCERLHR